MNRFHLFVFMFVIGVAALAAKGCEIYNKDKENKQVLIDMCVESGGIPVLSAWDNSLSNCIYPPKGSE